MFRWFRALLAAVQAIPSALDALRPARGSALQGVEINTLQIKGDDLGDRLDALEKSRAMWEAEMEAVLLKADSTLKAANNAESRARTTLKNAKKLGYDDDEGGLESEEELLQTYKEMGWVPGGNAAGGDAEGLHGVRSYVEGEPAKARALRAKYGG